MTVDSYNMSQLQSGAFSLGHIAKLVRYWQENHPPLTVDSKAGPLTLASIQPSTTLQLHWPLAPLDDGRRPTVTSGFRQPDRPTHNGDDIMYDRLPSDPPAPGNDPSVVRWWVPDGTHALAAHDGVVAIASRITTGYHVWITHDAGFSTGYFHLTAMTVVVGMRVSAGQSVGIVGDNPADVDPSHLHFELVVAPLSQYPAGLTDPEPHFI